MNKKITFVKLKTKYKSMDFDQGRLEVAKGAVGAYLNFRFGTQQLINKMIGILVHYDSVVGSDNKEKQHPKSRTI